MGNKNNFFTIILNDDTIGIVNQYYIVYHLKQFKKVKKVKSFFDYESAKRWTIQYIFIHLSLEDYGITNVDEVDNDVFTVNAFIRCNDPKHKIVPLDILFENVHPRRKCMMKTLRRMKPRDGYYTAIILKDDVIGILDSKLIFDKFRESNLMRQYRLTRTYKESDEFIRQMIPFHEWSNYNLDVGYLRPNCLLRRLNDEYEDLNDYVDVDLNLVNVPKTQRNKPQSEYSKYFTPKWEAPPMKIDLYHTPDEIHRVKTSGYVNMDEDDNTPVDNSDKEYESYYNEDLRKWVHRKKIK